MLLEKNKILAYWRLASVISDPWYVAWFLTKGNFKAFQKQPPYRNKWITLYVGLIYTVTPLHFMLPQNSLGPQDDEAQRLYPRK